MSHPFLYITTHSVDRERRPDLDALTTRYTNHVRALEGDLLAHYAYLDDSGSELSLVQVHRDAASAERHMQLAGPLIQEGLALTRTIRIQVYGEPGPLVRRALEANAEAGVPVVVAPGLGDGFTRQAWQASGAAGARTDEGSAP